MQRKTGDCMSNKIYGSASGRFMGLDVRNKYDSRNRNWWKETCEPGIVIDLQLIGLVFKPSTSIIFHLTFEYFTLKCAHVQIYPAFWNQ